MFLHVPLTLPPNPRVLQCSWFQVLTVGRGPLPPGSAPAPFYFPTQNIDYDYCVFTFTEVLYRHANVPEDEPTAKWLVELRTSDQYTT